MISTPLSPVAECSTASRPTPDYWQVRSATPWRSPPMPVRHHLSHLDGAPRAKAFTPQLAALPGWRNWWQTIELAERRNSTRQAGLQEAYTRLASLNWPLPTAQLSLELQNLVLNLPTAQLSLELQTGVLDGPITRRPAHSFVPLTDGSLQRRFHPSVPEARWQQVLLDCHDDQVHPLVRACRLYWDFVLLHPFRDGNGRAARLWFTSLCHRYHSPTADLLALYRYPKLPPEPRQPLSSQRLWGLVTVAARSLNRCPERGPRPAPSKSVSKP